MIGFTETLDIERPVDLQHDYTIDWIRRRSRQRNDYVRVLSPRLQGGAVGQ